MMDLELLPTFKPINADGEAESFELMTIEKVKGVLTLTTYKRKIPKSLTSVSHKCTQTLDPGYIGSR